MRSHRVSRRNVVRNPTKTIAQPSLTTGHPKPKTPTVSKKLNTDKLQFVHIPKTAGSTISESAHHQFGVRWGMFDPQLQRAEAGLCGKNYRSSRRLRGRKLPVSRWHMPPNLFLSYVGNGVIKPYVKPKFCVVRNPYSRMVSEYEYERSINKTTHTDVNDFVKDAFRRYRQNKYVFDGHLIPQFEYALGCEHVLRFENLETEFDNLMEQFDISLRLRELQRRKKRGAPTAQLNKESIQIINMFYREDFIHFHYAMEE